MLPKWLTPNPRKLNQNRGPLHLDKNNNLLQRMQWKKKLINPLLDQSFNMHKQLCLNLISLHDLWLLGWLLCLPPKYRLGQQRYYSLLRLIRRSSFILLSSSFPMSFQASYTPHSSGVETYQVSGPYLISISTATTVSSSLAPL
ncbi:hypothetical protein PIB30_108378 [Stylosanthes scabra]|uniref:Uncharacterized protein n=1 Tax=Stylosanthes scabra TaxID=79078 RepID=A0ABU6SZW5_9FABA|nr:hypothetical protein [Stylosanthes scabra]